MINWLVAAILALCSFGMWGLFTKLSVIHIDSKSALVFQTIGVLLVGIFTLSLLDYRPMTNIKGLSYGILTGVFYGIGCLFYFMAVDKGKMNTVVTLTALYPLITIFLSCVLLKESINFKQSCGIGCALVAIFLLI